MVGDVKRMSNDRSHCCYILKALIAMDWLDNYATRPIKNKTRSLIKKISSLNLEDDPDKQPPSDSLDNFTRLALASTIQKALKNTVFVAESEGPNPDEWNESSFSTTAPTQYSRISLVFRIELNLRLQYIKMVSYPLRLNQMLVFSPDQLNILNRFITFNLNTKLTLGSMTIDPQSGELNYQVVNNSLGHIHRQIRKAPNDLGKQMELELKDHERVWRMALPSLFCLLGVREPKARGHPYWKLYKEKENTEEKEKVSQLLGYLKQSYIEYPFMFDGNSFRNEPKRVRSKPLSQEDNAKKKSNFDGQIKAYNYYAHPFTQTVAKALELFSSPEAVRVEGERKAEELPSQTKEELGKKLVVERFESKYTIYSPIQVEQIVKDQPLTSSGWSHIRMQQVRARRTEDPKSTQVYLVAKSTQDCRYVNETSILRLLSGAKSIFVTRYFHSQHPAHARTILNEYCPLKSVDTYLHVHRKFTSLSTKLFFLYEIAVGIRFLRDHGIHHNDIKPANVLIKVMGNKVQSTFFLRIIDFGESMSRYQPVELHRNSQKFKRGCTVPYAPPEQVKSYKYSEKTDVFSFGVMLYEIIFDAFPLEVCRKGKEVYLHEQEYLRFYAMAPEKCSSHSLPSYVRLIYEMVLRCIHPVPDKRPSIDWLCLIVEELVTVTMNLTSYELV